MKINFNDLESQNKLIRNKILSNFKLIFQNSKFILGPQVALEKSFLSTQDLNIVLLPLVGPTLY